MIIDDATTTTTNNNNNSNSNNNIDTNYYCRTGPSAWSGGCWGPPGLT